MSNLSNSFSVVRLEWLCVPNPSIVYTRSITIIKTLVYIVHNARLASAYKSTYNL